MKNQAAEASRHTRGRDGQNNTAAAELIDMKVFRNICIIIIGYHGVLEQRSDCQLSPLCGEVW